MNKIAVIGGGAWGCALASAILKKGYYPFILTSSTKRAEQINTDIRKELIDKLEEFATYNDSLEEVFENKEQIEVSKFYERLPKPHALAVQEWLDGKIYHRNNSEEAL